DPSRTFRLLLFTSVKVTLPGLARPPPQGRRHDRLDRVGWDERLFDLLDDLEGQAEALYAAERDAELADRSRAEYAGVTLAGRLMASVGRDVLLDVDGTGPVRGE